MEELENSVRANLWIKVEWGRVACGHLLFAHPLQNIGNLSGDSCIVKLLQGPDPIIAWHLRPLVFSDCQTFHQPIVRKQELTVRPRKNNRHCPLIQWKANTTHLYTWFENQHLIGSIYKDWHTSELVLLTMAAFFEEQICVAIKHW